MCKVLIVDDEDDVFDHANFHLTAEGHEVFLARNGLEALQFLKAHAEQPPCILLTDLRMPVLDGWDLVYGLRRQSKWADLPVIVCSAMIQPDAAPPLLHAKAYWTRRPPPEHLQQIHQYCARHHQSWPPRAMAETPDRKTAS